QFTGTRSARRRIALAEELLEAADKKDLKTDLAAILNGLADAVRESNQLDPAERLYGAAVRDDLAKLLSHEGAFEPSQSMRVGNIRDLPAIAEKIPVQVQGRCRELT